MCERIMPTSTKNPILNIYYNYLLGMASVLELQSSNSAGLRNSLTKACTIRKVSYNDL